MNQWLTKLHKARVLANWDSRITTDRWLCAEEKEDEDEDFFPLFVCLVDFVLHFMTSSSITNIPGHHFALATIHFGRTIPSALFIHFAPFTHTTKKDNCTLHARSHNFAQFKRFMCAACTCTFHPNQSPLERIEKKNPEEKPKHKLYCIIK